LFGLPLRSASFRCEGAYTRSAERIVVLAQEISPTCDVYLRARLKRATLPVHYWKLGDEPPVPLEGAYVVVVRYVDRISSSAIDRARSHLAGVAYLLDDDLVAAINDRSLPLHYSFFMLQFWMRYQSWLRRTVSELWVASGILEQRYRKAGPVFRIGPEPARFPLPRERPPSATDKVRIFYHGQKTHLPERRWLRDVVAVVHETMEQCSFEIVGGAETQRWYRHLERVRVRPLALWPDYLQRSTQERFDIGLAPLVPTPFNAARSWVKYLDIARFGAVGIFADCVPYDEVVRDGNNGLLCSRDDPDAWIRVLTDLIRDTSRRNRLIAQVDWPSSSPVPPVLSSMLEAQA
jgi:hypothetical protein